MSDKNDDIDMTSDDDFYDETLDENFEFDELEAEEEFDDIDLDAEFADGDFDSGLDDEWDDEDSDDEYEDDFQPLNDKKKIGLNFNTIVIVGAVLVGGLVMFMQVSKKPEAEYGSAKVERFATALKMQGNFNGPGSVDEKKIAAEENSKPVVKEDAGQEGGFLFDENILDSATVDDMPPMPSPITTDQDNENQTVDIAEVSNNALDETPNPPPTEATNNFEEDEIFSLEGAVEKLETKKDEFSEDIKQVAQNAMSDIKAKQDEISLELPEVNVEPVKEAVMDKVETIIAMKEPEVTKPVEEPPVMQAANSTSLDGKLDSIIQRLESMDNKIEQIDMSNQSQIKDIVADIQALKTNKPTRAASSSSSSKPKAPTRKKKVVRKKAKAPVRKSSSVSWELRAAQPGKAWVSKKGQNNMQPVVVGDSLSGIGRVQDITYTNGRWIVRGNSGTIAQ